MTEKIVNQEFDKLASQVVSNGMEPIVSVFCHALIPLTGVVDNVGTVLCLSDEARQHPAFQLMTSREALSYFIDKLEEEADAGN